MSKSRRRWIHNAHTPEVRKGDSDTTVTVEIFPVAHREKAVQFVMEYWQFKEFAKNVRAHASDSAHACRERAKSIESNAGITPIEP